MAVSQTIQLNIQIKKYKLRPAADGYLVGSYMGIGHTFEMRHSKLPTPKTFKRRYHESMLTHTGEIDSFFVFVGIEIASGKPFLASKGLYIFN